MALREFVLNNFRWKLTAFLLAVLVWSVIKFAIYKEFTAQKDQLIKRQQVMVLKTADDVRVFRIDPPYVNVVVQAPKDMSGEDVEVFVDLINMPDVNSALKQVMVRSAEITKVVRTEPGFVMVERVTPVDSAGPSPLPQP